MYWWLFIKYIVSVFSESTNSRSWNAVSIRVFVQKHCEIWSWYSALTFIKCFWGDFFLKKVRYVSLQKYLSIIFKGLSARPPAQKCNPPIYLYTRWSPNMLFTDLLVPSPLPPLTFFFFFIYIFLFLHHCKLFPSLLLKWHLQMRVKSGRQWISNWKRHWTEDNATGSVISNQMIWNVKWCEIVAELNFMLPPSSMQHFFFLVTLYLDTGVKNLTLLL